MGFFVKVEPYSLDPYRIRVKDDDVLRSGGLQDRAIHSFPLLEISQHESLVDTTKPSQAPTCFDFLDDMLLCCIFRDQVVLDHRGYRYGVGELAEVKIKATVFSADIGQGSIQDLDTELARKLTESNFVGEVSNPGLGEVSLAKGTQVTSLVKCPVQTRVIRCPTESLVPIPGKLDPGEAVSIVSIYLPMFGILHHGREKPEKRFSKSSLEDTYILVNGGTIDQVDAIVKLARYGGVSKIFLLLPSETFAIYHVGFHDVILLEDSSEPKEWLSRLPGGMDLIIDLAYPRNFADVQVVLKENGRLVCMQPTEWNESWFGALGSIAGQAGMLAVSGAAMYDFVEVCADDHGGVVRDIHFLFRLLSERRLRPLIDKYVKTEDVPVTREDMRRHPPAGAVICENT